MSARKGTKVLCSSCYKEIINKEALDCSNCKQIYDLPCAKISFKRFLEIKTKNKSKWTCEKFITYSSKEVMDSEEENTCNSEISSMIMSDDMFDNITYRTKAGYSQSANNISIDQRTSSNSLNSTPNKDDTYNSLPNFTESTEITELREENITLSTQLASAHEEITNLNMEINNLKKQMEENQRKLNVYKNLLKGEMSVTSPGKQTPNKNKVTQIKTNKIRSEEIKQKINKIETKYLNLSVQNTKENDKTLVTDKLSPQSTPHKDVLSENKKDRTIYIFGGNQCIGLAGKIINSRMNSPYNKYSVMSFIKPNANTKEILQPYKLNAYTKNDKIILSIGENDTNPFEVMANLISLAQSVNDCTVLIMNVQNNPFLNVNKLNYMLKHISTNVPNCKFIDLKSKNNKQLFDRDRTKTINLTIDSLDYNHTYLKTNNIKIVKKCNVRNFKLINIPRKGTIPYYFSLITNKIENKTKELKQNKNSILRYFPIINKSNNDLNENLKTKSDDFFRTK